MVTVCFSTLATREASPAHSAAVAVPPLDAPNVLAGPYPIFMTQTRRRSGAVAGVMPGQVARRVSGQAPSGDGMVSRGAFLGGPEEAGRTSASSGLHRSGWACAVRGMGPGEACRTKASPGLGGLGCILDPKHPGPYAVGAGQGGCRGKRYPRGFAGGVGRPTGWPSVGSVRPSQPPSRSRTRTPRRASGRTRRAGGSPHPGVPGVCEGIHGGILGVPCNSLLLVSAHITGMQQV